MSDEPPFPDDETPKDGWTRYDMPVQQDNKWIVRVTDTRKTNWEELISFATEEEGRNYIKERAMGKVSKMMNKKADVPPMSSKSKRQGNYVHANYMILELTDEQKDYVRKWWDKKDLKTLTRETFHDETLNGHNTEAKSIKAYIASLAPDGSEPPKIKTTEKITKGELELTQEQVNSLISLLNSANPPRINELVRLAFPEINVVKPASREYRSVLKFIKENNASALDMWEEPVEALDYRPPNSISAMVGRVNTYVSNPADPGRNAYKGDALKPYESKCLYALMGYLKSVSFRYQAQQYTKKMERTLFESHFITLTHDKADLTSADQNLYIQASAAKVKIAQTERRLQKVIDQMEQRMEEDEKKRLGMDMVEMVNGTQEKLDKCVKEYQNLIKTLESTRAEREDLKINRSQSVLPLLEAWQKDEEARKGLLNQGIAEHKADEQEFERLKDFDGVVALIAGQSRNEAIRGA